nr:hypothetical protein BaRGS_022746 [Batillaria attramentaria]
MGKTRPSLAVVVLVTMTLTLVGVKGQADRANSANFFQLSTDQKVLNLAQYLAANDDLTLRLVKIAESLQWMVAGTNGDDTGNVLIPGILDALPGVFSSNLFKLVSAITFDEIKRVEISPAVMEAFENNTVLYMQNYTYYHQKASDQEKKAVQEKVMAQQVTQYKVQHFNKARTVNRIMLYFSARDFLFETNPNRTTVNPQCYSDTMDFFDAAVGTKFPDKMVDNKTEFDIRHYPWAFRNFSSAHIAITSEMLMALQN